MNDQIIRICENPKCGNVVPPPRYANAKPRKFCSGRCSHNYHSSRYEQCDSEKGLLITNDASGPQFHRRKPRTEKGAKKRLQEHHRSCPSNGGDYCLASRDSYGTDRICLIKSVMYEDWIELFRQERGYEYRDRVATTEQGRWELTTVEPPRAMITKLPRVPVYD